MTATLIDGLLWLVTLGVSVALARQLIHRSDLATRLFLGMILALAVHQILSLTWFLSIPAARLFPQIVGSDLPLRVRGLWPIGIGSVVIFACLTLHLFLVFPTQSRMLRRWRWSLLLVYVPGTILTLLSATQALIPSLAGAWYLRTVWPQVFFATAVVGLAVVRLVVIYFARATPRVQQQLTWLLWGLGSSSCMVLAIYALPALLGWQALASVIPGLAQLPILVLLSAFAVSMQRYQVFEVGTLISRSLVYLTLVILLTLLYLATGSFLGYLFDLLLGGWPISPYTETILTALVITLVALPLRDGIQKLVDRLFFRQRASHRQVLEGFSRLLTTRLELPDLLGMVAAQVEELFYPLSLAIVLGREGEGYRVALSRGRLAIHRQWRAGASFAPSDPICAYIATQRRPLYLARLPYDLLPSVRDTWEEAEAAGVRVLVPMHIRSKLAGWFVLGPKLAELPYTTPDLNFLSALADQSSVALENARLYGEMQQRASELAMLATVSSAISSSLDLEHVLHTIIESVVKVVDCDKSAIFELSEDGQYLNLRLSKGLSPDYIERARSLQVGKNNRTLAVTTREALIVPDLHADPRMTPVRDVLDLGGYRGLADVPLVGREGILGVLSVYFDHVHQPMVSELELLTTLANQAAIAIENARLYARAMQERDRATQLYQRTDAKLAQRVEELTAIEQISRQLTSTLDLHQVMDVVLERMLQATQADRGVISLYDQSTHTVWLLAQVGYPAELNRYQTEPWPDEMGITGRVARTGMPALVVDVNEDPEYAIGAESTRSQISVPVMHKGQVIGIVTVESDEVGAFGVDHLRFAELLADHAAIGINNAQLFQQVMEGRDRLEAILNSTRDAVVFIDNGGRLVLTNRRVRELLGAELEAWLWSVDLIAEMQTESSPLYHWTNLHPTRLPFTTDVHRPVEAFELACQLQSGDDSRYLEITASPVVSSSEQTLGWVAVVRDMTHQQELEQFREDLTSMVIHNLQGPLAAVIGSIETLQEFEEISQDMTDELLRIALESGRKLYARIESLLWLRRLEDSKMPLDLQPIPLPGIIQNVMDEYLPTSTRVGVEIEAHLAQDLPPVLVDEEVIGRVFSNLVDNALKYTPCQGRVEVRAQYSNSSSTPYVVCAVADTGPGIAPALQATIFGKFRRADENWRGRRKGMGIGLHYCKLAVEAHGGRIWLESEEGKGSTFYFTLPVQDEG